jgi:hypothetical protein
MTIKTTYTISCDNWPACYEELEIEDITDDSIDDAGFITTDDGYHFCFECAKKKN